MYTFFKDKILDKEKREVMMDWETPLMKKHAKIITKNGGDILEIGFGMGICANFIQQSNINTHTIIEIHDQIFQHLLKWAKDKPNVIPIKGDWFEVLPKNKKYDGIMFDTYKDKNQNQIYKILPQFLKPKGIFSFYSGHSIKGLKLEAKKLSKGKLFYEKINVNPPTNKMKSKYFVRKDYYLPKIIID